MKRNPKVVYPIVVLAAGIAAATLMLLGRPAAEPVVHEAPAPLVRVVQVSSGEVELRVRSQGRVAPLAEIDLVSEVSGKVVEVAPALAAGGFFREGEVLVRVDPRDYEAAFERAKAAVAGAEVRVAMEEAESGVATREWKALGEGGAPPSLVVRGPQLAEARAALAAARAGLSQAALDLERTKVTAPFDGRVRSEDVDAGRFVARGTPLARVYSTDAAEIRLPLPDEELAFLDVPLVYRDSLASGPGPSVDVHAEFGGRRWRWRGAIVRTEGQIDPATHVLHVVARVEDPYARGGGEAAAGRPPLAAGMFVDAEIHGRRVAGVVAVPRAAMRGHSRVFVVDGEGRLRSREVKVLRREPERVLLSGGLADGEKVCVSPLEVAVDGMSVRVAEEPDPVTGEAGGRGPGRRGSGA